MERIVLHHGAWLPAVASLVLLVAALPGPVARAASTIAFVHEDTRSTDPRQQIFNLRLLDALDPATQVPLTAFATAPTLVENPVWSRDTSTLAFASNVGNGLRSLEEKTSTRSTPTGRTSDH